MYLIKDGNIYKKGKKQNFVHPDKIGHNVNSPALTPKFSRCLVMKLSAI